MRVFVGLSGGVDSSVAAAILKAEGHEVVGVYMLGYQPPFMPCPSAEDRDDAMRVAAHLGIPFHTLDLSDAYKKEVVDYFIAEYRAGRTPNPDIMCNKHIKFGAFYQWAKEQGADAIATGHYARKSDDGAGLMIAIDTAKDQTYFLWAISKEALSKTLFPVGAFTKPEIREKAQALGLPTASKKDSQGVCFLGKIDMDEFLAREIPRHTGTVLSASGEVIGHHRGSEFVTLGQRHGFTLTKTTPHEKRHYVIAKNVAENTITIADDPHILSKEIDTIAIGNVNWLSAVPKGGTTYQARVRYRQPLFDVAVASADESRAVIAVKNENAGPFASGQSMVLYAGDTCIGGGIIA